MKETGTITITLEGVTFEETERCRRILHLLITEGLFNINNGTMNLHFNREGSLQGVDIFRRKWRRNEEIDKNDLQFFPESAIIKIEEPIK